MSRDLENWILDASDRLGCPWRQLDGEAAEAVATKSQKTFVNGSPRVWWLDLKFELVVWPNAEKSLAELSRDPDELGFLIPEVDGSVFPVFRFSPREVEQIVLDCPCFEYNFVDSEFTRLIIENDHNEFIVVVAV